MSTTPKKTDWAKADWRKSDVALALLFGVTKQAAQAARRNHSKLASPKGHGGKREGSGRKPKRIAKLK